MSFSIEKLRLLIHKPADKILIFRLINS